MKTYHQMTNFFCEQSYKTCLLTSHAGGVISCNGHYFGNVNLMRKKFVYSSLTFFDSGSVRRATISSHISSPLQNRENIVSLAGDVISILSSIQIEKYLHEEKSYLNFLVTSLSNLSILCLILFILRDKSLIC